VGGGIKSLDEVHGVLMQGAGWLLIGIAFDASARWIGCCAVDARELERYRVDPGPMPIPIGQEHRTVGHYVVK
jgi:hypothetical protein